MRPSIGVLGLIALVAPAVLAQNDLPNLSTIGQPDGQGETTATSAPKTTAQATASPTDNKDFPTVTSKDAVGRLSGLPTLAGVGIPDQKVPNTAYAPYMQKADVPDGTVFICVGAILGFLGLSIILWRGLIAWSLHRSVKRAAVAQNAADIKSNMMASNKKRGMYNVVGTNSSMSLDRLAAHPTGTSKPPKPFAQGSNGTPQRTQSSLFFSPTAGGGAPGALNAGNRSSSYLTPGNRSSNYLPAGYYATGNAAPPTTTHLGGDLNRNSLATPGNRYSTRSGISPPGSPHLPSSRGYDRAPSSRDGLSSRGYERAPNSRDGLAAYNRNSQATLNPTGNSRGVYGGDNLSQLSLNAPGGTTTGGRVPSAYLENLFDNPGSSANQSRERF